MTVMYETRTDYNMHNSLNYFFILYVGKLNNELDIKKR